MIAPDKKINQGWATYADLARDTIEFAKQLDKPDLVVAIPRSGLLPASIFSFHWNIPICSLQDYLNGVFCLGHGSRKINLGEIKNVLVVDDSIFRGDTISVAKKLIEEKTNYKHNLTWAAIYASKEEKEVRFYRIIKQGRAFQWNWRTHKEFLSTSMWDMDGCLCIKPTPEQNDDGPRYRKFIAETKPLFVPEHPIGAIVTSRLEKFRPETEAWLKKHNIQYSHLIMLNYPSGRVRRMLGHHGYHKAEKYEYSSARVFIEDEDWQAQQIFKYTGKPVLCINNWRLYNK